MTKKHERSDVIAQVSNERFDEFFADTVTIINKLTVVHKTLCEFLEDIIDEEDIFDELDELNLKVKNVMMIADCHTSIYNANNHYLSRTVETLGNFLKNVQTIVSSGCYPEHRDAEVLKGELFSVLGGLLYFLVSDFGIDEVLASITADSDIQMDEILSNYVKKFNLDVKDFCTNIVALAKDFKFRLEVFDEYPELEEEFERIAGPDYNMIPEDLLTIEQVKEVISGSLTIEELLRSFVTNEEGGDNEYN